MKFGDSHRFPQFLAMAFLLGNAPEVPFDFVHNQILLPVLIDGRGPYTFALDTGTQSCSIDTALAKRLGLPLSAARQSPGGAGTGRSEAVATWFDELRIGELTAHRVPAHALNLADASRHLGRPLHGVLGHSFLATRIVQIDYFRRRVRFFPDLPEPPFADTPQRISFPLRFRPGSVLPVLEDCYINDRKLAITLDTGSSLGLILFPPAIRHLGLEELARQGTPLAAAGYRGTARLSRGWVRSLRLMSIDLGAAEVAYVEKGYGEAEPLERRAGSLGNSLLQDFTLTLDYRHRIVTLERAEE